MTPKQVFEELGLICHCTFCDRIIVMPGSAWESRLYFCAMDAPCAVNPPHTPAPATYAALIRTETLQRPSRLKLHCSVYWPLEVWGELTNPAAPVPLTSYPGARVQLHITTSSSYVGAGELNLGPHAVKTNPVPIGPSPQPQPFLQRILGTHSVFMCAKKASPDTAVSLCFFTSSSTVLCRDSQAPGGHVGLCPLPKLSSCLSFMISFCFVILISCFLMTPAVLCIWPKESGSNVTSVTHKAPIRWTWEI